MINLLTTFVFLFGKKKEIWATIAQLFVLVLRKHYDVFQLIFPSIQTILIDFTVIAGHLKLYLSTTDISTTDLSFES